MLEYHKKILILTTEPFPIGLAGTNRIICYGKGFLSLGFQTEIICIKPTEQPRLVFNNNIDGSFKGLKFQYPGRVTVRAVTFWKRKYNDIIAVNNSVKLLIRSMRKKEVLFVIVYGNNLIAELLFILISNLFYVRIYKEESEHPFHYFENRSPLIRWGLRRFYLNCIYRMYDGLFLMTRHLKKYFLSEGLTEKKMLLVLPTIDYERFSVLNRNSLRFSENDYIAFCGSINQAKDGVLTLVKAFSLIEKKYPNLSLLIAGEGSFQEKNDLISLIRQLNIENRVKYIGRISSEDIPFLLKSAKVLLSYRPKTMQSEYGFPTKILEYLACGLPILTTLTGELDEYLIDGVNSFIVEELDAKAFSEKLIYILEDYSAACKVAQNGLALVADKFDPVKQSKTIIEFHTYI